MGMWSSVTITLTLVDGGELAEALARIESRYGDAWAEWMLEDDMIEARDSARNIAVRATVLFIPGSGEGSCL